MSQPIRTPKSVYLTLGAGVMIGAFSMAGFYSGAAINKAFAQPQVTVRTASAPNSESMAELRNLDMSLQHLAEFVAPAVVHIRAAKTRAMGENGERVPVAGGEGSGFIFRPDGYIITNDHVAGGFDKVTVILKNGREYDGKVIRAQDSDIAVIKIDAKDLPTLQFADSSKVRPGQMSMAVGAPFGLENTVTVGNISALGRMNAIQDRLYPDLIQTDTAINMGNSGGPLVNIDGQVIGINTAIVSPTGTNAGIGFAIPSNQARLIAEKLITDGKISRSMIGLVPENLKEFEKEDLKLSGGARVANVQSDGPAAAAGIKDGDIIVKIGTTPITDQLDLRNAMMEYDPGKSVPVEVIRNGERKTFNVKLTEYKRPQMAQQPEQLRGRSPFPRDVNPHDFFKDFPDIPGMERPDSQEVPRLQEGRARLGVQVGDLDETLRKQFNVPSNVAGAVVVSVEPGSIAEKLGMKAGDVIQSIGDRKISSSAQLVEAMKGYKWGDKASVHYKRFSESGVMDMTRDVEFK